MSHAITIGDVAMASGAVLAVIAVAALAVGALWFMAQGWDH